MTPAIVKFIPIYIQSLSISTTDTKIHSKANKKSQRPLLFSHQLRENDEEKKEDEKEPEEVAKESPNDILTKI